MALLTPQLRPESDIAQEMLPQQVETGYGRPVAMLRWRHLTVRVLSVRVVNGASSVCGGPTHDGRFLGISRPFLRRALTRLDQLYTRIDLSLRLVRSRGYR